LYCHRLPCTNLVELRRGMGLLCTFSLCFAWLAWLIEVGAIGGWRSVRRCKCKWLPCSPKVGGHSRRPEIFYVFFIHTDAMMQVVQGPSRRCMHIYPGRSSARFASRFNWYGKVLPRGVINSRAVQNSLFCKPLLRDW
jgi:hypothetical protein